MAYITEIENRKNGEYRVDVNYRGRYERFDSILDAQNWVKDTSADLEEILIQIKQIIITARKEFVYESCFAY